MLSAGVSAFNVLNMLLDLSTILPLPPTQDSETTKR
jgi:hypothetical protein